MVYREFFDVLLLVTSVSKPLSMTPGCFQRNFFLHAEILATTRIFGLAVTLPPCWPAHLGPSFPSNSFMYCNQTHEERIINDESVSSNKVCSNDKKLNDADSEAAIRWLMGAQGGARRRKAVL
jgi:hypothetical protein